MNGVHFDSVGNSFPGLSLDAADFLNFIGTDTGILRFLSGNPVFPFWPDTSPMTAYYSLCILP